jgi:hypothetical protein
LIKHSFTGEILRILKDAFENDADQVFERSLLLQYLNIKTKSANKGSKARGAFANHYALYVLIEDYVKGGFADGKATYKTYEGANFADLFQRQRQLPFGSKLQNHALNNRCNDEFRKYFPSAGEIPILRDLKTRRYWITESLLNVKLDGNRVVNIARVVLQIIDAYVAAKRTAFESFLQACTQLDTVRPDDLASAASFVRGQLQPNVDARIFEIVSFAILKAFYGDQSIFWGFRRDELTEEFLILYKTGRTNANDGGIDFVMRPLGRFFQVTETLDVRKYFLDIDKLQKFPLTFVIKSTDAPKVIQDRIRVQANEVYGIDAIVGKYMACIEEIINVPTLLERFESVIKAGKLRSVLDEIILQSKVEFNYEELSSDTASDEEDDEEEDDDQLGVSR